MKVGDLVKCSTETDKDDTQHYTWFKTGALGLITRIELRPEPLGRPIDRFYPDDIFYVRLVGHDGLDSGFPFKKSALQLVK